MHSWVMPCQPWTNQLCILCPRATKPRSVLNKDSTQDVETRRVANLVKASNEIVRGLSLQPFVLLIH